VLLQDGDEPVLGEGDEVAAEVAERRNGEAGNDAGKADEDEEVPECGGARAGENRGVWVELQAVIFVCLSLSTSLR